MIELVFVACLTAQPAACQEYRFLQMEGSNTHSCMMQAQAQLAQWNEQRPKMSIRRWSCQQVMIREALL